MARAQGGLVPSGVGYGEGYPLFSRLGSLGSVVSSPSGVRGGAPAKNRLWRFLKGTVRSFLYWYDKICVGQFALSSPYFKFWGGGRVPPVPRDLRPWSGVKCKRDNQLKYNNFRPFEGYILEMVQCSYALLITNRKSHLSIGAKVSDLVIALTLRYFTKFGRFRGS